jgi:mono/diheme cytochrome c family protein
MRSQSNGIYTNEQARRGEMLYVENCGACHGTGLGGGFGPPLTGPRFLAKWRDRSLGELFELMRITMPPTFPGGFGRQQNADMLAFILQKGKSPAGKTELVGDADVLSQIRLVPEK